MQTCFGGLNTGVAALGSTKCQVHMLCTLSSILTTRCRERLVKVPATASACRVVRSHGALA